MAEAPYVSSISATLRRELPRDRKIARLAERQHGVVSLSQLKSVGVTASAARDRAAAGRLVRLHRGVYAVGHAALTAKGRWMAAVLACGPRAALSHASCGALTGIRPSAAAAIEVSVQARSARQRRGIRVHTSVTLAGEDVTTFDGIPCTTVARTLVDLAGRLDRRGVEKTIDQAEMLRVFDLRAVEEALARAGPVRGGGLLREVLAAWRRPAITDRELEERFFAICRRAGVREPLVNQWIVLPDVEIKADFFWPAERLAIETDGWESHGTRRAFVRDRARDRRLKLAGYDCHRFTWDEVRDTPDEVGVTLRDLLRAAEARARQAA